MSIILFLITTLALIYFGIGGSKAILYLAIATFVGVVIDDWTILSFIIGAALVGIAWVVVSGGDLRQQRLSKPLLQWVKGRLPKLSATESEALKSGSVDWDGELFSGQPNWEVLHDYQAASLSEAEQAFMDGPLKQLCDMLDDWKITNETYDLPESVWQFIREQGFFGLVIPEAHGGKGFSATAHSEIVMTLSTRSVSTAVTVMVPNSLGPGELLMHYGTDEQKNHYLPRLADGTDIPCFALTSPIAGSDAGAIPDKGIVCKGEWEGKETLGLKVTWNKRYITLAPVATVIGLAIKVYDPDALLGDEEDIGVTCVLVPHDLAGVNSGARHLPMNTVFMNGPTWGKEVFIPMSQVIGGQDMLGKGWTMLLECLSIGRSISLPAMGTGAGKMASLMTGSYAYVREQFGRSISQFEGVQEALEPIAGMTYMMDAARLLTTGMLDRGVRPAVPSAVLKYRNTDLMRKAVNHAMDVVAGRGVISGPRNFMANGYQALPIAITVEGANILTRSLMIFGQGAIRCHPFIVEEINAANMEDQSAALAQFDSVFYRHLAHTTRNTLRTFVMGLTGGRSEAVPSEGDLEPYYRQLNRFAAGFATLTDVTLLSVGGGLKARQRLSGRMADCLAALYFSSAVIKFWHEAGYPEDQRALVEWSLETCLRDLEQQMHAAITNFPVTALRWPLRLLCFPLGANHLRGPDDNLGTQVARAIVEDTPVRMALAKGCYISDDPSDSIGRVLNAYRLARETESTRQQLHKVLHSRDVDDLEDVALLMGHERKQLVDWAVENDIIPASEKAKMIEALDALYDVIRVDAFDGESIAELGKVAQGQRKLVERNSRRNATIDPDATGANDDSVDDDVDEDEDQTTTAGSA